MMARLRGLASLTAAIGLVAGVPLALVLFVGWPLPSEVPTWESFTEALEQRGVTYEVLVNVLAVVVWAAWVPLTWAILVEAVAAARGRAARQVMAWPGAQYVARKLVASATLLASGLSGMRTAAAAEPLNPLVVATADAPAESGGTAGRGRAEVAPGDGVEVPGPGAVEDEVLAGAAPGGWRSGATFHASPAGARAGGAARQQPAQGEPPSGGESTGEPARDPEVVHRVERGDTFWGLAEDHLGSGLRWREIRDANVGRAVGPGRVLAGGEDHLEEGWRIVIPGAAAVRAAAPGTVPAGGAPSGSGGEPDVDGTVADSYQDSYEDDGEVGAEGPDGESEGVGDQTSVGGDGPPPITIRPGDHFWAVAERQLETAWGRPVTADEVAPYWQQLVAANLDRVDSGDPDLIFPGEQFAVPATPSPGPGSRPAPGDAAGESDASGDPSGSGGGSPATEVPVSEAPAPQVPEAPASEAAPSETPGEAQSEAPPSEAPAPTGDGGAPAAAPGGSGDEIDGEGVVDEEAEDDGVDIPSLIPFGASAALAGLLLVALSRRRRSRRRLLLPGQVITPRAEEDARLEREFAVGARDLHETVAAASRAYGAALADDPDLPLVTGMFVSPALDVIIQLEEPAVPVVPFEPGPASDRWELYLDELDLDPELGPGPEPSVSVLDTPVVIGRTAEGDWVVVDLECVGAVEVDGDEGNAADLVRSMVAELALQPQTDRMVDLTVVGVDGLSAEVLEQGVVSYDHLDEDLVRRVERVASEANSIQGHRGAAARAAGLPRDGLFVTVVALGGSRSPDPVLLERLSAAATPGGRGVGVVAVGSLGPGACRVLIDEYGQAHVPHLGVTVEAAGLAAENLERVERLLADEPEVYPPPPDEAAPEAWPEWPRAWSEPDAQSVPGAWMGTWQDVFSQVAADEGEDGRGDDAGEPAVKPINGSADDPIDAAAVTAPGQRPEPGGPDPAEPGQRGGREDVEAGQVGPEDAEDAAGDDPAGSGWAGPDRSGAAAEAAAAPSPGNGNGEGAVVAPYEAPPWELCVRIFADHVVETPDGTQVSFRYGDNPEVPNKNTHRGPELIAYLALSGRAATAEEVRDHLWWDRPVALGTVNKLLYGARKVLGGADFLSHAQEDPLGRYRLAPTIVTDAQLLTHGLEYARTVANHDPDVAIDVLRSHLAAVEAVAFRNGQLGQGLMEWAAAYRVVDAVEQPVIEAALLMSRLSCERGRSGYYDALWAIDQGLRACPFNEALVRVAMEIEALLGNPDAVNHRYLMLATRLARDELEPEPETSELRARLGGTSRLRSAG